MTAHGLERDDYETLVIGSGFGGAVTACRLAQAGIDVAIVERGRRYPAGSFPRDLTKLGVRCLTGLRWPRLPASLLSAFSRTARVLNTTTPGYAPSATEA